MIPLATLITEFLSRTGLSSSTVKSYTCTLMSLVSQWGRTPVELIDRQLIEDYLSGLTHLAYTTQNRHLAIIVALMNFAVERGYIKNNPATRIKMRKPDATKGEHGADSKIRYLTSDQLTCLYEVVTPDIRLHTVVRLLHQTGARVSEVLSLDLEQMNAR